MQPIMMTIEDFVKLPKNEQVYKLFHDGREIFVRKQLNQIIKLFLIDNLFVEIWYCSPKNIIEKITVIDEDELINLYEKEINIKELINI
jgi:hypothetical protein